MSVRQIHVFISHSWKYFQHYDTLESWIFRESWRAGQASLDFRNFSVPRNDPIHNAPNDVALKKAIFDQISRSHVVVIPTGMYAQYSKWIGKEIEGAQAHRKPILAVNPWAQERKASVVVQAANSLVGWNKEPIVREIWKLYNGS